ncbi:MAG: hypothetical protein OSA47_00680 [Novosphingopyxis baekryungensis]|jgi:hypothetical protein|nr:hypothetical protein [Novosphingopyxis baekryungensis]
MNTLAATDKKNASWKRLILPMGIGAVAGYTAMHFGHVPVERFLSGIAPDHLAGMAMGLLALVVALGCFAGSLFPASVARSYGIAPGEDVTDETTLMRWSALCAVFYALFLLTLGFTGQLTGAAAGTFAVIGLIGAVATNAYLWHRYDELWREITAQACVITFTLFHYVLMAWAALAVLTDSIGFGPISVLSVLLGIFTGASIYATAKRGMVHMP